VFGRFILSSSAKLLGRRPRGRTPSPGRRETSAGAANQQNNLLDQVRELVSQDRLVKAKRIVTDALAQSGDNPALLRELAVVESLRGHHEVASTHLAAAIKLAPENAEIASEYATSLHMAEHDGEALSFLLNLPDKLRHDRLIRGILGKIYRAIGWHAHAVDAYGSLRDLRSRDLYRCVSSWWACGGPLHVRRSPAWILESRIDDIWHEQTSNRHAMLGAIHVFPESGRAGGYAQLDTSHLWLLTAQFRLEALRAKIFRWEWLGYFSLAWLVAAILISSFEGSAASLGVEAIGGLLLAEITVLIMIPLHNLIASALRRARFVQFRLGIWLVASYLGVSLMIVFSANLPAVGAGMLTADIGVTTAIWLSPFYRRLYDVARLRQRYLREFMLGSFLDLLIGMRRPSESYAIQQREQWVGILEDTAFAMEHFLIRYVGSGDSVIREWISARARGAASAVRLMACNIAIPSEGTWEEVKSHLQQGVKATASGDFGALPKRESSFPRQRFSQRRPVVMSLVQIAVVLVPLSTLIWLLVAFERQSTIQLASAAVITGLVPLLIGVLLGALPRGSNESSVSSDGY
jgi:hypothetical protein